MESMLMGIMAAAVAAASSVCGRARSVAERCVGFFMLRVRPRGRRAAVITTTSVIENGMNHTRAALHVCSPSICGAATPSK